MYVPVTSVNILALQWMYTVVMQIAGISTLVGSEPQLELDELDKTKVPSLSPLVLSGQSRQTLHWLV